ncbi:MAG TPA: phage virion morphogenesis protein [Sphingobium sp.]
MTGGFDVSIQLDDAALDRALSAAIKGGADMSRPMGEIAEEWLEHVHDRFEAERDPLGMPWAKRRDHGEEGAATHKLLQHKGNLLRAVVPEFGPDFATIGVLKTAGPARYARIHNEGGTIVPKNGKALSFGGRFVAKVVMPKRQYIGFGDAERRSVVDILGDFMRDLFGEPK